jgi:hypothetical protein
MQASPVDMENRRPAGTKHNSVYTFNNIPRKAGG